MWGTTYFTGHQLRKSKMLIWILPLPCPWSRRWPQDELWLTQQKCGPLILALCRSKFNVVVDRVLKFAVLRLVPTTHAWHKVQDNSRISSDTFQHYPERQPFAHPQRMLVIYHIALSKHTTHCPVYTVSTGLCVSSAQMLILSLPGLTFQYSCIGNTKSGRIRFILHEV